MFYIEKYYNILKDWLQLKVDAKVLSLLIFIIAIFASATTYLINFYISTNNEIKTQVIYWKNRYDSVIVEQNNERIKIIIKLTHQNDSILKENIKLIQDYKNLSKNK